MTQVEQELAAYKTERDTALTIGVFDGVHVGHKQLLARLKDEARNKGIQSGVVTFHQHPEDVLFPEKSLTFLTNNGEKTTLLKNESIEIVVSLTFSLELSRLSAREFLALLIKYLRMKHLVVGPDFALGKGRDGSLTSLEKLGREMGFSVSAVPPVKINGEVVSSTAIRQALSKGDLAKVEKFTGRVFSYSGRVISGDHRGTGLGFPTANLEEDIKRALPADGVYATWVHIDGKTYSAMTNIGKRPTFNGTVRLIEIFVLDYQGNLYGKDITVDFIKRLRGEKRFASAEELKKQIADDIRLGREILERY